MLSVLSALHHISLFVDRIWSLLLPVRVETGDLQLLQTRCAVMQLAMNRTILVSVVTLTAVLLT